MDKGFFHICADGEDARHFISSKKDYLAAMNIVALCAANSDVKVVSFSLEDTHPHFLLYGTLLECLRFKNLFESIYRRYASETRGRNSGFSLHCDIFPVGNDQNYLMNVAVYTIFQPTKDGKRVMPFDYFWGSGSLYFRPKNHMPVWLFDEEGLFHPQVSFGSFSIEDRRNMIHSRTYTIPEDWLVSNGIVLPTNYVDIARFESIYRTHNCYRVFLGNSRKKEEEILMTLSRMKGIALEDSEAREICGNVCKMMFGTRDPRRLTSPQRIRLAQHLRSKHKMIIRQIAVSVRLPEKEIRQYVP